jgi:hypothetical protein
LRASCRQKRCILCLRPLTRDVPDLNGPITMTPVELWPGKRTFIVPLAVKTGRLLQSDGPEASSMAFVASEMSLDRSWGGRKSIP